MEKYYDFGIVIRDFEIKALDSVKDHRIASKRERERLRRIYRELTGKAVYSRRVIAADGNEGTAYYYKTEKDYNKMRKKHYEWWSDVLSATVGND